jgi:hypothetical protein
MLKMIRHAPIDDPVATLATGVWVAVLSFVTGFVGYLTMIPTS